MKPTKKQTASPPIRLAVVVAGILLALAACGSAGDAGSAQVASLSKGSSAPEGTDSTTTAPTKDPEEAMLEFARCMREHGVDMPDPQFEAGGAAGAVAVQVPEDSGAFQEAQKACGGMLGAAAGSFTPPDPEEQARMQEATLEYARCMRDHGVDFPDPQMDGGMVQIGGPGIDPSDPDFKAADEACRDLLPGLAANATHAATGAATAGAGA